MTPQHKKLAIIPVGITIVIVLALLILSVEKEEPPKEWPVVTLSCGEEYDYVREIAQAGGGKLVVPVGNCETGKVLMPAGRFWIDHDFPVEATRYYESEPPDGSPVLYEPEKVTRPKSRITAIRFRNDGSKNGNREVVVSIIPR